MGMSAGGVGDHIQVAEVGIGDMVDGRQDDALGHGLDRQSRLDGGRRPQGMADLGFVGRHRNFCQAIAENGAQAIDLRTVSGGG